MTEGNINEAVDLADCENEPITIPGAIQPHGLLLALRGLDLTVVRTSANLPLFLDINPREMLGQPVGQWFDEKSVQTMGAASLLDDPGEANPMVLTLRGVPDQRFDGILHRCGADLILELERVQPGAVTPSVRGALSKLQNASTEAEACWIAAKEARRLTGFDRVMIYRFAHDWSGEVVAEIRGDGVDSYLGTHFPASDIPKQARELYTRKLLGLIPNVTYSPVPLLALEEGAPLDMTHSVLRSVSPIHLEFLRNMGVAATLTVSLVVGGRLWGMIACHHGKPWFGPFALRQDCQFLGQVTAAQIGTLAAAAVQTYRCKRTEMLAKLLEQIAAIGDFGAGLTKGHPTLMDFVESTGAGVLFDEVCLSVGAVPSDTVLFNLREWLIAHSVEPLFAAHTLPLLYPPASEWKSIASGLLAVRILPEHGCYVFWFRPEVIRTVTWAGDPNKPVSFEEGKARLSPRKSFEAWKQSVELQSLPWTEAEIESAAELRNTLSGAITGQIQRALTREMQRQANEEKMAKESAEEVAKALRRSEKRFQELADNAPVMIWVMGQHDNISFVNRTYLNYFEVELADVTGHRWKDLIHSDDREFYSLELLAASRAGRPFRAEGRVRRGDGEWRWIDSWAIPRSTESESEPAPGMVGCSADITDRKRAEERIRELGAIVESSEDAIFGKTLNGIITSWNKGAEKIYGFSAHEILGKPVSILLPPGCEDEALQILRAVASGASIDSHETVHRGKNGREIQISLTISPIRNPAGGIMGVSTVGRDVTERKRVDKELQASQERFREANEQLHVLSRRLFQVQEEERRHLARELHDQLGQTLIAAKIDLQTARRLEERNVIMERLDSSIATLERLLEQARDLSLELRPPLLDDLGLVPALRWYLDQHARRAGLCVEFFTDLNLERFDTDIETACFRVAQETLRNVVRHARAQKVSVELHWAADTLHLVVRDDGIGFDLRAAQQSTTLGLLGIRERVALVGGELDYKLVPGRGTEVHVFFPVRSEPDAVELSYEDEHR